MNLSRVVSFARSPWAVLAAVVLAALVFTCRLNQGRSAEAEARRLAEAETLRLQGQIVALERTGAWLAAEADRLAAENPELRRALEEARRASPGAKPVAVARASTGRLGTWDATPFAGASATYPTPGSCTADGKTCTPAEPTPGAPARPCVLAVGDEAEIRVDEVVLETKAGNHVLVGTATAYRFDPDLRLFGGTFRAPISTLAVAPPPAERAARWGAGPYVAGSGNGIAYGVALAAPPLRLWRLELEAVIGAGVGPAGVQGSAALVGRL